MNTMTSPRSSIFPRTIWALVIFTCASVAYGTHQALPHPAGLRDLGAVLATAAFVVAFPLAIWRPGSATILIAGLTAAPIEALAPNGSALVVAIASIAVAAGRLERLPGTVISVVIAIAFIAADLAVHSPLAPGASLSVGASLFFTYLGMSGLRRLREEKRRTEELLQEVLANREAQIRAAALDERARLAREIHDVLAHTLSALTIQLEGTRMLVGSETRDGRAVEAVDRAWKLAREGLDETRRAVGALRGDALPGPELLPDLASGFERDSGIPCLLSVEGEAHDLGSDARLALYRTAQEALTNIRKHADASSVSLRLRYLPEWTELTVENQGMARQSSIPGGGYGLNGMRERAELLGGCLEAGPTATGFRVYLRVPA